MTKSISVEYKFGSPFYGSHEHLRSFVKSQQEQMFNDGNFPLTRFRNEL